MTNADKHPPLPPLPPNAEALGFKRIAGHTTFQFPGGNRLVVSKVTGVARKLIGLLAAWESTDPNATDAWWGWAEEETA